MTPVIVMPALNEGSNVASACASLGFGCERPNAGVHLVLVDNGSTDDTHSVMEKVAARSAPETVTIVDEPVRGYVPARVAGIEAARRLATGRGIGAEAMLLLQVDADTHYLEGYIAQMIAASARAGPGHLMEGCSIPPLKTDDRCLDFRAFEAEIDEGLGDILRFGGPNDVVIDDKLAGFRLSDYDAWGGHRDEFTAAGHAILAETTRLFMRAKSLGAVRLQIDGALAVTSQRRILQDPALAFATAGFPRDAGWVDWWRTVYEGARDLDAFRVGASDVAVAQAVRARRRHLVAMFTLLPSCFGAGDPYGSTVLGRLGLGRPINVLAPGLLLERLFSITDDDVADLLQIAISHLGDGVGK